MNFEIVIRNGRWTVNGKGFEELTMFERTTLNNFFQKLRQSKPEVSYSTYSRVRKPKSANNQNQ